MSTALLILGVALIFFGALGVAILPDLFLRLHAATKCGVTGSATVLIGLALRSGSADMAARLALITVFLVATAPLVPHILGVERLLEQEDGKGR